LKVIDYCDEDVGGCMGIESPVHLIFIAAIALIVLGPKRLPELARSLGSGMREFRDSLSEAANGEEHTEAASAAASLPAQAPMQSQTQLAASSAPVEQAQAVVVPEPVAAGAAGGVPESVSPAQTVPSGDAPDSRPL
jgi:sec-independent protein translocase protein TatA